MMPDDRPSDVAGSDERTLKLAGPGVHPGELAALLGYQRALAEALGRGAPTHEEMAAAHLRALAVSGLTAERVEILRALARRFSGNRATVRKLRESRRKLDPDRAAKLDDELTRLDQELGKRDRPETLALLLAHEDELVELHRRLGPYA